MGKGGHDESDITALRAEALRLSLRVKRRLRAVAEEKRAAERDRIPPPSRLAYSVAEASKRLALSPRTLHRRIHDGTIRAVRIGGALRIPADVLYELLRV